MVRRPEHYPRKECEEWRQKWRFPFPNWRTPTALEKYAAFDCGWGFQMHMGFGWVEIDRKLNRKGRFRMKILTPARKCALRRCGKITAAQLRSAIRLFYRHGDPREVVSCVDCIGFVYPWSFVGIERDGYTHT